MNTYLDVVCYRSKILSLTQVYIKSKYVHRKWETAVCGTACTVVWEVDKRK